MNARRQRLRIQSMNAQAGCGWRKRQEQQRRTDDHRSQGSAKFACHDRSSVGCVGPSIISRLRAAEVQTAHPLCREATRPSERVSGMWLRPAPWKPNSVIGTICQERRMGRNSNHGPQTDRR